MHWRERLVPTPSEWQEKMSATNRSDHAKIEYAWLLLSKKRAEQRSALWVGVGQN
jgi:hypothetical protein